LPDALTFGEISHCVRDDNVTARYVLEMNGSDIASV